MGLRLLFSADIEVNDESLKNVKAFYVYFFNGITNGTIRHGNNAKYSDGSIQIWKNFGKSLNEYCPKDIPFSAITKPFADRFSLYLEKKGMMANTVNKYVTVLTAVERRAEETYSKLLKKKKSGKKFTENERKWYYKQHKLAEPHNGKPLWERNKHDDVIRSKYEQVSSHTSRRSRTTNLYKTGVLSNKEMRSITGHQSEKVFEKYIRVGISEQA